ncbi:MAG: UbiA family prenyltransferase [Thermoguttaceae bacterium]
MTDDSQLDDEVRLRILQDDQRRRQLRLASPWRAWLQLTRLPNVFTSMADVMMGFLFAQPVRIVWGDRPWSPTAWDFVTLITLLVASGLLYAGGVVLNDVLDLDIDRRERPGRPLPSGRISVDAARRWGYRFLIGGVALATATVFSVGHLRPGVVAALLAIAILAYDAWLKRTPLGPVAMGACRMLNVMLGMNAVDASLGVGHWLVAGGLGVYVAGVTWFARRENEQSERLHLSLATAVMTVGLAMIASLPRWSDRVIAGIRQQPQWWYLLIAALGMVVLRRCVAAIIEPSPRGVRLAVTQCILSIVMLDAVACYSVRGMYWASVILLFWAPAILLGRWIEAT